MKISRQLLASLGLAAAAACGSSSPAATTPSSSTPVPGPTELATPAAAPAPVKPRPVYGTWGFDVAGMDKSVTPGNNFFQFANGSWVKNTPIPPDKASYAMFTMLYEQSQERTKKILEAAATNQDPEAQKIADFYKSFMDEAAIEALGVKPVQGDLDEIAKLKDAHGVALELAKLSRRLTATPIQVAVAQDDREPDKYIGVVGQGGLGLPDRDMYDLKNKQFEPLRAGYKKYITQMFTLAGVKGADKRAAAVYTLEEKLAATHWTRVQNRDPQKTYNKLTIAQLEKLAPGFDWKPWLKGVGLEGQPAVNVNQPSAITGAAKLIQGQPVAVWRDYLALRVLTDAAPYLAKPFVDAHFELYGKTLRGTPELAERWKRGVDNTSDALGEAIGKLYVAKHFTPETKAHADRLVKNLLVAMGQRIDGLTWMGAATKAKAKEKLATYYPKIGYPKQWRDYSALKVVAGDALGNEARAAEFEYNRNLAKLGKPVDREEWGMTPMTVNAYYNPVLNEIVFPAAILQPPFFDPNADDAVNYGGIGAVIGHEISHGFDDQGAQYDASGALKNWWTKDDEAKFKAATDKLVAQYSAYCPFPAADGKPAQCVKGELTLGENIADVAGITIAYTAYKLSLGGKPAPVIDGFTPDQRFFLGFAQVWRGMYRDAELANRLVTDPHSPVNLRASTVRNIDAWYDAFKPKDGEALVLAPDQRVRIW
ncbi:MAG TPA: M13 family metallopeptidase [Kofleriaceae bacterium]|nr:M13 family metallopeptidase [Kofleriaceae bacterium]